METPEEFLAHHGIKGMRWGVRRDRSAVEVSTKVRPGKKVKAKGGNNHPPSDEAIRTVALRRTAKKSTTHSLSNKELQEAITRMNLEQQFSRLAASDQSVGKKVAKAILGSTNDQHVNDLAGFATKQTAKRTANKVAGATVGPAVVIGVGAAKGLVKGKK